MLQMYNYIVPIILGMYPAIAVDQLEIDPATVLNTCIDGMNHKTEPGPEGELYKQCYPWKHRACCTQNTTRTAHHTDLYGFTYDHCSQAKKMSTGCRTHFMQDLCFYECSPNVGPWIVKVDMKIRQERYFQVPLCQSDCDAWFKSCSKDYTCTDNWTRNFKWKDGKNYCPSGSKCRTFAEVYGSAENFCSQDQNDPQVKIWTYGGEDSNTTLLKVWQYTVNCSCKPHDFL